MVKIRGTKGIYWCDFWTSSGSRVRHSLHTTNKKDAQAKELRAIAEAEEKIKVKATDGLTLKEAFDHTLRVREQWRSAKSLHSIHQVYGMLVNKFGEECPLSKLDDDCLLKYGEEMHKAGLTPSTINKRFSLVSVLVYEARRKGKYQGKPLTVDRYRVDNARKRLISPEEAAEAISILRKSDSPYETAMADLIIVLADTGMRLSEALGVDPRNIYHDHKAVHILKTKNGDDRIVPLTDRALQALTRRPEAPIFYPLTKDRVSHIWRRLRKRMGLENEKEFVLHSFRHTFGSTLANAGMDAFRIQKVMGHKSIVTTQGYVKVATSALSGIADIMQNKYAQNCVNRDQKTGELGLPREDNHLNINRYPGWTRTVNPQVPGSSPGRGAKPYTETTSYTPYPLVVPQVVTVVVSGMYP